MPEAFLLRCKYPAVHSMQGLQLVNLQQPLMDPASQGGWAKALFPQCSMGAWPRAAGIALSPCPGQHPAFPAGTSNLLYWPTCFTNTHCHPRPCRMSLCLQCFWGGDVVLMPHTLLRVPRGELGTPTLGSGGYGPHLFPWGQVMLCCLW